MLGDGFSRDIRVNLRETAVPLHPIPNLSPQMAEMHQEMMRGRMQAVEMTLSIALSGGQWLNVATRFERPPLQWPLSSFLTFGLTAALILVAAFWFVMTRLTGPLRICHAPPRIWVAARQLIRCRSPAPKRCATSPARSTACKNG